MAYTLIAGVQMGFLSAPLPVANAGVGSAHGVSKTLEGRAVGDKCAVGTHLMGLFCALVHTQKDAPLLGQDTH